MQGRSDQQSAPQKLTSVGEHDGSQFICAADEFGHRPLFDRDARRRQPQKVIVVEAGRAVGEQHDVIAPPAQQQRGVHGLLAAGQHRQRLTPNLPAVAERAMEHRSAPQLNKPGRTSCLTFITRDSDKNPSQAYRTLFLQELLRRGVLGQSFVTSAAHTDHDIERPSPRGCATRCPSIGAQSSRARSTDFSRAARLRRRSADSRRHERSRRRPSLTLSLRQLAVDLPATVEFGNAR